MVVKGRIGLSKITANKLSAILRHSALETRYFETLVFFNQARSTEDRNRYYRELCALAETKRSAAGLQKTVRLLYPMASQRRALNHRNARFYRRLQKTRFNDHSRHHSGAGAQVR
jgi:hypothetical protein